MSLLDTLVRRCSRALHQPERADFARGLMVVDALLSLSNPLYAAFAERRHTGQWGRMGGIPFWIQSWRYAAARLFSTKSALFTMDFGAAHCSSATAAERPSWPTPGSCAGCATQQCCKMASPWGTLEPCPLLRSDGCGIYGGLVWRLGPCGRYPETQPRIDEYGCPRFTFETDASTEPRPAVTDGAKRPRVRLPVLPTRRRSRHEEHGRRAAAATESQRER